MTNRRLLRAIDIARDEVLGNAQHGTPEAARYQETAKDLLLTLLKSAENKARTGNLDAEAEL